MRVMEAPTSGSAALPPVGARVVVRHRLPAPDPLTGASLTDVVGDLVEVGEDRLVVRSRRGVVEVLRRAVTAVKEVPPTPSRRGAPHLALSVEDLQRVMVGAWPAPETSRLGDWLLRSAGGFTQRANSVVTAGDPGLALPAAVDAVESWYSARGRPAMLTLAGPVGFDLAADPLGAELLGRGYATRVPTTTLTASTATVVAAVRSTPSDGLLVSTGTVLEESWLAAYRGYREAPEGPARAVLAGSPEQVFASATDPTVAAGEVVGIGRLGLAAAWGGVAAMWVAPAARRRGLATALLAALAGEAARRGTVSLHLQTDRDNAGRPRALPRGRLRAAPRVRDVAAALSRPAQPEAFVQVTSSSAS